MDTWQKSSDSWPALSCAMTGGLFPWPERARAARVPDRPDPALEEVRGDVQGGLVAAHGPPFVLPRPLVL